MDFILKQEQIKLWISQISTSQPIFLTSIAVVALAGCLLLAHTFSQSSSTSSNRLPPGPKGFPLIGLIQLTKIFGMIITLY